MPNKYNFNVYGGSAPSVRCIEEKCNAGGRMWEWPEEKQKEHFLSHSKGGENILSGFIASFRIRKTNCRICGNEFEQERKRGRPRVFCYICKPEEVE